MIFLLIVLLVNAPFGAASPDNGGNPGPEAGATTTPIKYLVVIFDENISFDHYFGTYPVAANPR